MIERYTPKEIGEIWKEENKYKRFLEIESIFSEALEKFNIIEKGLSKELKNVKISIEEIKKIEEKTHHDVVAFIQYLSNNIKNSKYLHLGLTSSDILDTTLVCQIKDATSIILEDLDKLINIVKKLALKYKDTLCIGRTHGMAAEIYSFGLKFLYFYNDLIEERKILNNSIDYVCSGKISGAVGTFAHFSLKIEEYVCKKLGINYSKISTQIVSRERFSYYLSILALIGSSLERFATEIRHLSRSEVAEVKEPFYPGQKGSSAMPHKQNPIICERICGLARVLRSNMLAGFENINLWHERDISHSSVERIIIPDSTIILDYMLKKMQEVLLGLVVYKENMLKNIELNRGLIYSQKILLLLMKKGLDRMTAYNIVQDISLKVINSNLDFKEEILKDKRVNSLLSKEEIDDIFNPYSYLKNIDRIYERFSLL